VYNLYFNVRVLKIRLVIIIAFGMLSVAGNVLATSPKVDGDIRIRIQNRSSDETSPMKETLIIPRVRLNADSPVDV